MESNSLGTGRLRLKLAIAHVLEAAPKTEQIKERLYLGKHVWGGLHLEGGLAEAAPQRSRSKLRALKTEGSLGRSPHPLHNGRNWQRSRKTGIRERLY
jgi:hypothetical protein